MVNPDEGAVQTKNKMAAYVQTDFLENRHQGVFMHVSTLKESYWKVENTYESIILVQWIFTPSFGQKDPIAVRKYPQIVIISKLIYATRNESSTCPYMF